MANSLFKVYHFDKMSPEQINSLLIRDSHSDTSAIQTVNDIIERVAKEGLSAILDYTEKFDGVRPQTLMVDESEFEAAQDAIPTELKKAFQEAAQNIQSYHELQMQCYQNQEISVQGSLLGFRFQALGSVAVYVPGGKAAYPSSVLMGLIPAQIAGVQDAILVTPPRKDGLVDPAVLYCAQLAGCKKVMKAGGAQGIAAAVFGYGGAKPDLVIGPGNRYVTAAKSILAGRGLVRIDAPAGPSEIIVIADHTARADWVAADLLSQAEHGSDSPAILLCNDVEFAKKTATELQKGLDERPGRREWKQISLRDHSYAIVFSDIEQAFGFSNDYAPEHLEICTQNPQADLLKIKNAGSVFLGHYAPVALGDYYSGTNHVLPTGGAARFYSSLGVDTFLKRITWQHPTRASLQNALAPIMLMSKYEGFDEEHGHSVAIRFQDPA